MLNFRRISLLLVVLSSLISCAQKKNLSVMVSYVLPYCGGARPTPEMEKDAATPKPYANKKIIIVSENGKVDSVKTDAAGKFKRKFTVGRYKFYEAWRYYKSTPDGSPEERFDRACMVDEWKKEFMVVNVYKKAVKWEKNEPINLHCDWAYPCLKESHMPPRRE